MREFGDFVCAYTFPLADINALVAEANQIGRAAAVRVYYGCNAGGDDHRLFLAVLDQNENVLAAQSAAHKRSADSDPTTKCPPGCRADAIIQSLL